MMMRWIFLLCAYPLLTGMEGGCGGDDVSKPSADGCRGATPPLVYVGELDGEDAFAELEFAPELTVVLTGVIETESAVWTLSAHFEDGEGAGQLVDEASGETRPVTVRIMGDRIELDTPAGGTEAFAPCADCVALVEPAC